MNSCPMIFDPVVQAHIDYLERNYLVDLSQYDRVIFNSAEVEDISEAINDLDGNTIVILQQSSPENPFIARRIAYLKYNTWIIGVTSLMQELVTIRMPDDNSFNGRHWLELGRRWPGSDDIGRSGISGLRLIAPTDGTDRHIDSVISLHCFDGSFSVSDNVFYLNLGSSVFYWCYNNTEDNSSQFVFERNLVNGLNLNNKLRKKTGNQNTISLDGLFVEVPNLQNNQEAVVARDNKFLGNFDVAIKVTVGDRSQALIAKNKVNDNGNSMVQTGFKLHHRGNGIQGYYVFDGNNLEANTGAQLYGGMDIKITDNQVIGGIAFEQIKQIDLRWNQSSNYEVINIIDGSANQWTGRVPPFFGLKRYQGTLEFDGLEMTGDPDSCSVTNYLANTLLISSMLIFAMVYMRP